MNWRPHALILYKVRISNELKGIEQHDILRFYSSLLGGQSGGYCVVGCVLEGDNEDEHTLHKAQSEKTIIRSILKQEGVKGFAEVAVAPTWRQGANYIIQLGGIGGLTPNTVLVEWPSKWHKENRAFDFTQTLRTSLAQEKSVLAVKGVTHMPSQPVVGTIDVWWMIHDGGFLILLCWLLVQHEIWRGCQLRVFTVMEGVSEEKAKQAANNLTSMLRKQRLVDVQVEVILVDAAMVEPFNYNTYEHKQPQTSAAIPMEVEDLFNVETGSPRSSAPSTVCDVRADRADANLAENENFESDLSKDQGPTVKLNNVILARSKRAQLVVMNMPDMWGTSSAEATAFMSCCDTLTVSLDRVLFVHSAGHELVDLSNS